MPAHRSIAFLRAINVGGRRVKMDALRAIVAELGYAEVETFIASGNVIFRAGRTTPAALEAELEAHLRASLGYEVETFVRTDAELAEIAAFDPFPDSGPVHSVSVGFLKVAPTAEGRDRVHAAGNENEELLVHGREVYWLARVPVMDSTIWKGGVDRALGGPTTFRNVTTVRKLVAKYPPGG